MHGTDKDSLGTRILALDELGSRRHRRKVLRDRGGKFRIVQLHITDECRAAGGEKASLLRKLLGFAVSDHIGTKGCFDQMVEA
jgi:hypothetical protein